MGKVLIISNMFPNKKYPSYGIFVKRFCEQLDLIGIKYNLSIMIKSQSRIEKIVRYILFFFKSFFVYFKQENRLIYIHYASHSSIPILFAYKFMKKRIYVNVHGSDVVPENPKQEHFQKYTAKILKIADKVIAPSEYFKDYIVNKYGINSEKVFVYPSAGVNHEQFRILSEDKDKFREEFGLKNSITTFGYVGRISAKKGWDTFIKACYRLSNKRNDFQIVIVGDGEEKQKMDELITKLGMTNIITLPLLDQDKLCKLYNSLDCFVFPTMREGESLGLVGLESMACGCPIIASNFAAPKYYVNERNGFKFEVNKSIDLASKMNDFLNLSQKDKSRLKAGALESVKEYYVENIIKTLKKIMGDINE